MTPEELEKVRERALRFVAPVGSHHTKIVQLVHDRDNLLAHIDAQEAEIKRLKEKYDKRGQYIDKLMAALEAKRASDAEEYA